MVEANGCKHHEWIHRKIDEHDNKIQGIVGMKLFSLLIAVLLVLFGSLFAVNLSTNAKVSDVCMSIQSLAKDVQFNTNQIRTQWEKIDKNRTRIEELDKQR